MNFILRVLCWSIAILLNLKSHSPDIVYEYQFSRIAIFDLPTQRSSCCQRLFNHIITIGERIFAEFLISLRKINCFSVDFQKKKNYNDKTNFRQLFAHPKQFNIDTSPCCFIHSNADVKPTITRSQMIFIRGKE
jgi:hypothetical protein